MADETEVPLWQRIQQFGDFIRVTEEQVTGDPGNPWQGVSPYMTATPINPQGWANPDAAKSGPYIWPQSPQPIPPELILNQFDPFESVLIEIVKTNRRKRADYAQDGDPFSNFTLTADLMGLDGFSAVESSLFNVCQKLARLKALRANGRMHNTQNESVADTYLDLAVYAVITYAIYMQAVRNYESAEMFEKGDVPFTLTDADRDDCGHHH